MRVQSLMYPDRNPQIPGGETLQSTSLDTIDLEVGHLREYTPTIYSDSPPRRHKYLPLSEWQMSTVIWDSP